MEISEYWTSASLAFRYSSVLNQDCAWILNLMLMQIVIIIFSQSVDEKGLSDFLMDLYQEKDQLKENFLSSGSFTAAGKFPVFQTLILHQRIPVLVINFLLFTYQCQPFKLLLFKCRFPTVKNKVSQLQLMFIYCLQ